MLTKSIRSFLFYGSAGRVCSFHPFNYLIIIRAISALLDARVLLLVPYLDAHHRIHVQARQLPRLDYRHSHLKVLRL